MNVGERALLSERGNAEPSRAGISYNLHSPAIFPKGWGGEADRCGRRTEEGKAVRERYTSNLINSLCKACSFYCSARQPYFSTTCTAVNGGRCGKRRASAVSSGSGEHAATCPRPCYSLVNTPALVLFIHVHSIFQSQHTVSQCDITHAPA